MIATTRGWTTSEEIRGELTKAWDRGVLLRARIVDEPLFPMRIRSRRPSQRELSERFADVRDWIRALEAQSRARLGTGYEILWAEVDHRQLGRNRVPDAIVIPTEDDALDILGRRADIERFDALARATLAEAPELRDWIASKPHVVLDRGDDWLRILGVVSWLRARPRPGVYARQIDVAGVDTKLVEAHRGILSELLDCCLPADAIDGAASSFEARYGLRSKPARVRFRVLDPDHTIGGLDDLEVPIDRLATSPPSARRIFITENEINGLAFPRVADAIVVFGLGYGVDMLVRLPWLKEREIHYWGDIDTHGLVMLDRLRAVFPNARSFLMDRETLLSHEPFWVHEARQHLGPCPRLVPDERALFDELVGGRFGEGVRLEQERIRFSAVERALAPIR